MNGWRRLRFGPAAVLVLAVALLVLPGVASAAVRYAAPAGTGPAGSCPQANPCSIEDAVEHASVAAGDEVVLGNGDYNLTETLTVGKNITVHGVTPGYTGSRIISEAEPSIFMIPTQAVVSDLTLIKSGDKGQGLGIANGLAERVQVIAPQSIACELSSADAGNAVIRNSICSGGVYGVLAPATVVGIEFAVLDGVTAHTDGGEYSILALGENDGQINLTATNTVALGGTIASIGASAEAGNSARADVSISSSAYVTTMETGAITTLPAPGSGSNIAAAAVLANPAGRDFHQLPASPTIDAGVSGPNSGALDWEAANRVQGPAIDIGADEAPDASKILALLGKKVKAKRTLRFEARCLSTACGISGKAVVKPRGSKKKTRKLTPASAGQGEKTKLKTKLPKKLARQLKRKGGKVKVRATGFANPVSFEQKVRKVYKVKKG